MLGTIIVIGIIALVVFKIFTGSSNQAPATTTYTTTNTGSTNVAVSTNSLGGQAGTSGGMIALKIFDGSSISVKNFIKDPVTVKDPINAHQYYIGPHPKEGVTDPTATDNPPYIIDFDDAYQSFTISLLQKPLGATRQQAEQFLMTHLGISQNQMCTLQYTLTVSNDVDPTYTSKNLGFSFCPGATQLP